MNLEEMRSNIDDIDSKLLELFLQRMKLSDSVAKYKAENGLSILNTQREREILDKVTERSGDMEMYSYRLFSNIMQLSRARQAEICSSESKVGSLINGALGAAGDSFPKTGLVACQGVEGANSQVACDKLLPRGRIVYVKSFDAVFDAVASGLCQFGVLPIDNSTNGSVREVYDLLQSRGFYIVRSTRLNIRHELMVNPGTKLSDLREIYSHPQAIGQCRQLLSSLDNVKIIPTANTALAARDLSESGSNTGAVIASHPCATLYGLETLKADIQDTDNNYTRFICVAKKPAIYPGANHVSLIVDTANTPGALYSLLSRIAAQDVNITKLESSPVSGRNFEYVFFMDLDLSVQEPGGLTLLADLERSSESFVFLGAYQEV